MRRAMLTLSLFFPGAAAGAGEPAAIRVGEIQALHALPDGRGFVGHCRDQSLVLYDQTGRIVAGHERIAYHVLAVAVDPRGRRVATAEQVLLGQRADAGRASRLRLWALPGLKPERTIDLGRAQLMGVLAFSPDGKTLASARSEGGVDLWDVETGTRKHSWAEKGLDINTLIFSDGGRRLICAGTAVQFVQGSVSISASERVVALDAATGKNPERFEINATWLVASADLRWLHHQGYWYHKAPPGRGELVVNGQGYAGRREAGLIDRFNGRTVFRSETGPAPVEIAARGPFFAHWVQDPEYSMSAADLARRKGPRPPWKHLRVGELRTGRDVWQRADPDGTARALSPDGRRLAVARGKDRGSVEVFDLLSAAVQGGEPMAAPAAWKQLADPRGEKLLEAYRALLVDPDATLRLLRREIRPAQVDRELLARRVAELNDPRFGVRERASAELFKMDGEGWLRQAVEKPASAEQRQRIEALLKRFSAAGLSPDRLQVARALDLMALLPPEKATPFLDELVRGGAPEAWLTREAQAARRNLGP